MSKSVTVTIPHRLSKDQARDRIQSGITELRQTHAGKLTAVEEQWKENHLDFHLTAMGQQISGRLDVNDSDVKLEVDLPWMLALIAGKFKGQIEREGQKMLENKKPPAT